MNNNNSKEPTVIPVIFNILSKIDFEGFFMWQK
jgi:hypothetical protein